MKAFEVNQIKYFKTRVKISHLHTAENI